MSGRSGFISRRLAVSLLAAILFALSGLSGIRAATATGQPRALVLDPFPDEHSPGYTAQDVVTLLQTAGFDVTELAGSHVTVSTMKTLSRYSIVYLFTHSGPLPNDDASVSTGDTRHRRYKQYFDNQSMVQMRITSANKLRYFDAVTGRFIHRYSGTFSPHSIMFLNACTALGMTQFWKYLKQSGVGTLISWHYHVTTIDADVGAHDVFTALAAGKTVAQAIKATQALGAGTSTVKGKIGTLSYTGDGQNSVARAMSGALSRTR